MGKFPGWRTMTSAERRNAKAAAIFAHARELRRKTHPVAVTHEGPIGVEVIERFATIREAEDFLATSRHIDKEDLVAGKYGIDAPEEMVNP